MEAEDLAQIATTLVVWVPMLGGRASQVEDATRWAAPLPARHFWDPESESAAVFRERLGLDQPAWDVYLLYGPDARWPAGGSPPPPDFWMHQLGGVDQAPRLDAARLAAELAKLSRRSPAGASSP